MKTWITILLIGCFVFVVSCKKDKDTTERFCWQIIDNSGANLNVVCNKTEAELLACVHDGTCGFAAGSTLGYCNYYQVGGDKFCWMIGNNYLDSATEHQATLYSKCYFGAVTPVKTTCIPCAWWYHREKRTYKPTNTFTYSQVTKEHFCGDTTTTLYQGRQIIRKDDIDSLIVIQFSNNGQNW